MKTFIKSSVIGLENYEVVQDEGSVKLNQNESPYDLPFDIKEDVFRILRATPWNRYPQGESKSLHSKIAAYTDFPAEGILAGNGSDELIQAVISAVCQDSDKVVVVRPGFTIYKRAASIAGADVYEVPLKEDFSFDVAALLGWSRKAKLVFLASPNNPTGTVLSLSDIERIARICPGLLVVDEAYYEYSHTTAKDLILRLDNVLILRTFSKAMGLAGIRLGYALGQPAFIQQLSKAKMPFSLGFFQKVVGEAILEKKDIIDEKIRIIIGERERMFAALEKMKGVQPVRSQANFVFFRVDKFLAEKIFLKMMKKNVLVRDFNEPGLSHHLRITVGTREENNLFLESLRDILGKKDESDIV